MKEFYFRFLNEKDALARGAMLKEDFQKIYPNVDMEYEFRSHWRGGWETGLYVLVNTDAPEPLLDIPELLYQAEDIKFDVRYLIDVTNLISSDLLGLGFQYVGDFASLSPETLVRLSGEQDLMRQNQMLSDVERILDELNLDFACEENSRIGGWRTERVAEMSIRYFERPRQIPDLEDVIAKFMLYFQWSNARENDTEWLYEPKGRHYVGDWLSVSLRKASFNWKSNLRIMLFRLSVGSVSSMKIPGWKPKNVEEISRYFFEKKSKSEA